MKIILVLAFFVSFLFTEEVPCTCNGQWELNNSESTSYKFWTNHRYVSDYGREWLYPYNIEPQDIYLLCKTDNYYLRQIRSNTGETRQYHDGSGTKYQTKMLQERFKAYCVACNEPSDSPPSPPENNITHEWKQIGGYLCSELDKSLPASCSDANRTDILVQNWSTGCCGDNAKCWQLKSTCDKNDTDFPKLAENTRIINEWSEPEDKSTQCEDNNGTVEEKTVSCKKQYQCVTQTEEPTKVCDEQVSSYVSPRNGTFHEDIALTGVDFGLHYDSSEWNSTSIAHGWSLSSHARLKGNKMYLGSGSIYAFKQSTQENNLTVVTYGSNEYLFDTNGKLQSTRDLYTKETQMTFAYDALENLVTITDNYGEITTIERDSNATVTSIIAPHGQTTYLAIDAQGDLAEVQYEDTSSYVFEYERHLMTVETEPNGNRFLHFFDDSGKVVKVIDAELGEWNFGSTSADTYGSHTVTRASGDIITYKNHFLENNTTLRTEKVLPTGDVIEYSHSIDDSINSTLSCGMQSTNIYKTNTDGSLLKDPYTNRRVLESSTVVTPSGLSNISTLSREYLYQRDGTLKRITNTSTTNSKTSQDIKNFKRHRSISISSEGKKSTVRYDSKMQNPLYIKAYGLHKTFYEYDTEGRATKETTGDRVTTYSYTAKGNLQS
ncbi:MAG: hypothetical protein COA92_07170, partial [Sulfurovum sp.]